MSMNCFWVPFGVPGWHRGWDQDAQRWGRKDHARCATCSSFLSKKESWCVSEPWQKAVSRWGANALDYHGSWRSRQGGPSVSDTSLWDPKMNLLLAHKFWGTPSYTLKDNLVKMIKVWLEIMCHLEMNRNMFKIHCLSLMNQGIKNIYEESKMILNLGSSEIRSVVTWGAFPGKAHSWVGKKRKARQSHVIHWRSVERCLFIPMGSSGREGHTSGCPDQGIRKFPCLYPHTVSHWVQGF